MTGPVRGKDRTNSPRRGTRRPISSTSPSKAASSTVGQYIETGRMIPFRLGLWAVKTVLRIRNFSSTIDASTRSYQSHQGQMWSIVLSTSTICSMKTFTDREVKLIRKLHEQAPGTILRIQQPCPLHSSCSPLPLFRVYK